MVTLTGFADEISPDLAEQLDRANVLCHVRPFDQAYPLVRPSTGFDGFFSIEPHLGRFDAFGGLSGPNLWTTAYNALTGIFTERGISWQ